MDEKRYLSVTSLNRYIAYKFDTDVALKTIYIKGEISNARLSKGHLYFVLKDDESEISSIIFANVYSRLSFIPKDGMKVLIVGTVQVYPKKGNYNLIVNTITEYGQGLIYQRFIELKDKLEKAGLFDPLHKKSIPEYCEKIGVITSETGDAIKDITSTIQKLFPLAHVYIYNALVQGTNAPKSLIKALKKANKDNLVDVLIIGRGGGSIEDLDCFNDEELAYEIYNSHIPIVSGVGHENDYTICDFVADFRAPTPTGAAVKVAKDQNIIIESVNSTKRHLSNVFKSIILNKESSFEKKFNLLKINSPLNYLDNLYQKVCNLEKRISIYNLPEKLNKRISDIDLSIESLNINYKKNIYLFESKFMNCLDKLILVNPLNIMKKGYTMVYKDNKLVMSKSTLEVNDEIDIHFHDGEVKAKIEKR